MYVPLSPFEVHGPHLIRLFSTCQPNQPTSTPATWRDLDRLGNGERKALKSKLPIISLSLSHIPITQQKPTYQLLVSAFSGPDQHLRHPILEIVPLFNGSDFFVTGYTILAVHMGAEIQSPHGSNITSGCWYGRVEDLARAWVQSHVWSHCVSECKIVLRLSPSLSLEFFDKDKERCKSARGVSVSGQAGVIGQGVRGWAGSSGSGQVECVGVSWGIGEPVLMAHVNDGAFTYCTFSSFNGGKSVENLTTWELLRLGLFSRFLKLYNKPMGILLEWTQINLRVCGPSKFGSGPPSLGYCLLLHAEGRLVMAQFIGELGKHMGHS